MIESLNLVIKPTLLCNARCIYCHSLKPSKILDDSLLEELFRKLGDYTRQNGIRKSTILWHGGEPMLAGNAFYMNARKLQDKYLSHLDLLNGMQSNTCLYKGDVRETIKEFLSNREIGACLDPFHPTRLLNSGEDYYKDSLKGVDLLLRDGFKVSMIYVVHGRSVEVVEKLYYYFKNLGVHGMLFHPLEEFDHPEYYLSPEDWGRFLIDLFNVWESDDFAFPSSPLDDWMESAVCGSPVGMCEYGIPAAENVSITMDPDGFLFPCPRFQDKGMNRIGHISQMTFEDILAHPWSRSIRSTKLQPIDECKTCEHYDLCTGGCVTTHNSAGKTMWCDGLKKFLGHVKAKSLRFKGSIPPRTKLQCECR